VRPETHSYVRRLQTACLSRSLKNFLQQLSLKIVCYLHWTNASSIFEQRALTTFWCRRELNLKPSSLQPGVSAASEIAVADSAQPSSATTNDDDDAVIRDRECSPCETGGRTGKNGSVEEEACTVEDRECSLKKRVAELEAFHEE